MFSIIAGLIAPFIPLIVRMLGSWLDSANVSAETRAKFLVFIEAARKDGLKISVTKYESAVEQSQANNAEWDRIQAEEKKNDPTKH